MASYVIQTRLDEVYGIGRVVTIEMLSDGFTTLFIYTLLLPEVKGGEYCFKSFMETQYCSFGCCGSDFYKYCCDSTGPITGIIVGLVILVLIIVIAICCCRRQASQGRVLGPSTVGYNATTVAGTGTGYPQQTTTTVYQQGYVYPSAQTGYTPVPSGYPTAQAGYPYQQQPQQHPYPPPAQPPTGYPAQPYPVQQMAPPPPSGPVQMQTTEKQAYVEPSAPPPSYEDIQKMPR